jgi:hypothetical protein
MSIPHHKKILFLEDGILFALTTRGEEVLQANGK